MKQEGLAPQVLVHVSTYRPGNPVWNSGFVSHSHYVATGNMLFCCMGLKQMEDRRVKVRPMSAPPYPGACQAKASVEPFSTRFGAWSGHLEHTRVPILQLSPMQIRSLGERFDHTCRTNGRAYPQKSCLGFQISQASVRRHDIGSVLFCAMVKRPVPYL